MGGCKLTTYKSVKAVEGAVTDELKARLFTPKWVARLVAEANAVRAAEAKRPPEDAGTVRTEIRQVTAKRNRMLDLYEAGGEKGRVAAVATRLDALERSLTELRGRLREIESRSAVPTRPITEADVWALREELPALLAGEVAVVAPLLREITGPVRIAQGERTGKCGSVWIAKFQIDGVPALARLARRIKHPTADTWDDLCSRGWKFAEPVEVRVSHVPAYERVAAAALALSDGGQSHQAIAIALGSPHRL